MGNLGNKCGGRRCWCLWFTVYDREVETREINVKNKVLRLCRFRSVHLLHFAPGHLVKPFGLLEIASFIFFDELLRCQKNSLEASKVRPFLSDPFHRAPLVCSGL